MPHPVRNRPLIEFPVCGSYICIMLRIGIAGKIGCGKSTLGKLLTGRGFPVIDADLEAHKLYATDADVRAAIAKAFGADTVTGTDVNRKALASHVFGNPGALRTLEDIVYPVLQGRLRESLRAFAMGKNPPRAAFIEGAVLFKWPDFCRSLDEIWIVEAPESVRLARLLKRGLSREDAERRIRLQRHDPYPKNEHTTRIDNGGDEAHLAQQLPV